MSVNHDEEVTRLYREHRPLLLYIAGRKFGVPVVDAECLLHEVVIAFMTTNISIQNPRAWLVATMCNASRSYWRRRRRIEGAPDKFQAVAPDLLIDENLMSESLERQIAVQQVLGRLEPRDRDILRMHYFEQMTANAIAERVGTTRGYAEKLIFKALVRARRMLARPLTTVAIDGDAIAKRKDRK